MTSILTGKPNSSCDLPCGPAIKNLAASAGDAAVIPESGRPPGEGNGHPLQYSCLENSVNKRAWWVTDHGVAELDRTEQLSTCLL